MKLYQVMSSLSSNRHTNQIDITVTEIDATEKPNSFSWETSLSKRMLKKEKIKIIEDAGSSLNSITYKVYVFEEGIHWAKDELIRKTKETVARYKKQILVLESKMENEPNEKTLAMKDLL